MDIPQKKRLTVGLLLCHMETEYSTDLYNGVISAVKDNNLNLVIFPGMYASAYFNPLQRREFDYQISTIYDYAKTPDIDIMIVTLVSIGWLFNYEDYPGFLDKFKGAAIVALEEQVPGFHCISVNNKSGMRECLKHLIEDHGYRKICCIKGKAGNRDSEERYETYLEVLKEYNLPYEDKMVAYGDFSEYCENKVSALLENNPGTEAICFINDYMALAAYSLMKSYGQSVGKDLAVVGFDNTKMSKFIEPPLTTVDQNTFYIGYNAVLDGLKIRNGEPVKSRVIDSHAVIRNSCGCHFTEPVIFPEKIKSVSEASDTAVKFMLGKNIVNGIISNLDAVFQKLFYTINEASVNEVDFLIFSGYIDEILNIDSIDVIHLETIHLIIREYVSNLIDNSKDELQLTRLVALKNQLSELLLMKAVAKLMTLPRDFNLSRWASAAIMSSAMTSNNDKQIFYDQVMRALKSVQVTAAKLFLFENPIMYKKDEPWHRPEYLLFEAGYNRSEILTPAKPIIVPVESIFSYGYNERSPGHIQTIFPLYINEEQLGLLICEVDMKYFFTVYSASFDISSAIKMLYMSKSLKSMSITDELTSLYNRRGFFEKASESIDNNYGKKAMIIFADLDNLKIINDTYSHEDGDYALTGCAKILKRSLRKKDIPSRLGGDEFIIFTLEDNPAEAMQTITGRLRENMDNFNKVSKKPYYVELSFGYASFVCSPETSLNELVKLADSALYQSKKNKRKSPIRQNNK